MHRSRLGDWAVAVAGRPRLTLTAAGLLAAASLTAALCRLEYHTQRDQLLSADRACQKRWHAYLEAFGHEGDVVVVIEGGPRGRLTDAVEGIAGRLRRRRDLFDRLFYKVDLSGLAGRGLLYLPPGRLEAVREEVRDSGPLLGPVAPLAWRVLSLESLVRQAAAGDRRVATTLPDVLAAADAHFAGRRLPIWPRDPAEARGDEAFAGPRYFFSRDGRLAFLLARPVTRGDTFTPAAEAVNALRDILDEARAARPDLRFGLTGLPVLEHDEMAASAADSERAALLAALGVALLYGFAYRRWRPPALTLTTLGVGAAWALGWVTVTVGHLNILSAAFGVMLIGMGDYGVLWVARYDAERAAGHDPLAAQRRTAAAAGPGIVTAAMTTSLAFFAAALADFRAVSELGWIAGGGVLLCAASCLTVMPALMAVCDRRPPGRCVRHAAARPRCSESRPAVTLILAALVLAALAGPATRIGYDANLLNLQTPDSDAVRWERELIARTEGANWSAVSYTGSREQALAWKRRYEASPLVGRVAEVASLIPENQAAKRPTVRDIADRLARLPGTAPEVHIDPDPVRLQASLARLDSPTARALTRRLGEPDAAARLREFDARLRGELHARLARLRASAGVDPITLDDIPISLRERYVGRDGEWLVRAFAAEGLWEPAALERFAVAVRDIDPEATGKPFGTLEGLRGMKDGFLMAGVYALIAIVIVLAYDFRRIPDVLLALLPLAVGGVACVGILSLLGIPFNPANMVALPLIVGVGVDHGVHVLHEHRRSGRLTGPTARGVTLAALTTVLGFGALAFAGHRGVHTLGVTLAVGVACCLAASLVVLPALLAVTSRGGKKNHTSAFGPVGVRAMGA